MRSLILGVLLFALGQAMIWIQTNGQFVWPWFKKNPIIISVAFGSVISYILIHATRFVVEHFDGLLWPSRFIGFSTGILSFSILTYAFLGEGITPKTAVSLILALSLVAIQLLWK